MHSKNLIAQVWNKMLLNKAFTLIYCFIVIKCADSCSDKGPNCHRSLEAKHIPKIRRTSIGTEVFLSHLHCGLYFIKVASFL